MKMLNADHFWRFFDDFSSKVPESGFLCETPAILHLARLINWQNASNTFFRKSYTTTHCSKSSFFLQKFNFDCPRKIVDFLGWKTRENVGVLDFLAVDNFDFTKKIVKKNLGEKLVKMLGICTF